MFDATPIFRAYARRRRRTIEGLAPAAAQLHQLRRLLNRAAGTRFGRDHGFEGLSTVEAFQAAVPLRRYEDFWRDYWQAAFPILDDVSWPGRIPYFAVTSGTTGDVTKYIPVSREMNLSNRQAALDLIVHHLAARPKSRLMGGRNFMLGGSTDLVERAKGVRSGDLSGIAAREVPFWARARYFPPLDLALIEDWEEKVACLAEAGMRADIRSVGGTPSWLLILFDRMAEIAGDEEPRLANYWPNLELLIHGGVNFAPYLHRYRALLEGSHAELREVYAASEGFVASADLGYGEGLRLNLDIGLFYEFVPVEELDSPSPTRHWLGNAEPGANYALVLSNCAGMWAYVLGDTVRLVERDPPRLLITGRTAYMLSAFGEHVIGEEVEAAVAAAASVIGREVTDYTVGAVFPGRKGELGGHLYIVEFDGGPPEAAPIAAFAEAIDRRLCAENEDYAAHRAEGFGMKPPRVYAVREGTFAAWMKSRGKLGGQNKVPRILSDTDRFDGLCAFVGLPDAD